MGVRKTGLILPLLSSPLLSIENDGGQRSTAAHKSAGTSQAANGARLESHISAVVDLNAGEGLERPAARRGRRVAAQSDNGSSGRRGFGKDAGDRASTADVGGERRFPQIIQVGRAESRKAAPARAGRSISRQQE